MSINETVPGWRITAYLRSPLAGNRHTIDIVEFGWIVKGLDCPDKAEIKYFCEVHLPYAELLISEQKAILIPVFE